MSNQKKVFLSLLLLVSLALIFLLKNFVGVISLSILIVLMFNPVYKWMLNKSKGRRGFAATTTVIVVLLSFLLPMILIGVLVGYQVQYVASHLSETNFQSSDVGKLTNNLIDQVNSIFRNNSLNYEITANDVNNALSNATRSVGSSILARAGGIGSGIPEMITDIILFLALITFLFPAQESIISGIRKISPLSDEVTKVYLNKMAAMARSMINGTFVVALIQGLIGGITLWIAGVPYTLFFGFILIIASMIPVLGSGIIMVPIALVLLATGNLFGAIMILLIQIIIISNIDNLLRPKLVEEDARLPEAITLLGIIAGLNSFGILGLIFGPVIMLVVYTTYDIYLKYYAISIKNYLNQD